MPDLFGRKRQRFSRLARRRRSRYVAYGALGFSAALSLVVFLVYLSERPELLIQEVQVQGNRLVSTNAIIADADDLLSTNIFGVIPRRNALLFPRRQLVARLAVDFPAIGDVSITRSSFSTLVLTIKERTPEALWCDTAMASSTGRNPCYFLDAEGLLFSPSPDFSSGIYLRFMGSASSTPMSLGEHFLPPSDFGAFMFFLQSIKQMGLVPQTIVMVPGAGQGVDFEIELANKTRILISGKRSLASTLSDMAAFFANPAVATSSGHFLNSVEYIDFRVANKIYYKPR